jgi:hypothetical protein
LSGEYPEPREWTDCAYCRTGTFDRRAADLPPLSPCPECGQPPRCRFGAAVDGHCERPATVKVFDGFVSCGQHIRDHDLSCEEEEWQRAQKMVDLLYQQAEEMGNNALIETMELAEEMCAARVNTIAAERAEIPW